MKIKTAFSGFSTNDLETAKAFYSTKLGLSVKETPQGLELDLPDNSVFIYPKPNHEPATFTVLNLVVDDIESAVDDLTAKGVAFEHYDNEHMKTDEKGIARSPEGMPGPKGIAWFKDSAGNFLSLIQEK